MAGKARWQVAWLPEAVRGRTRLLSCTALGTVATLLLATPARSQPAPNARPGGGVVTAGSATIGTSANTTTITQSSQRAAINWKNFNVGSQQTVDFIQPSSSSVALNRVISPNPSQIAGHIDANGQVILLNQSGVIFYQGAQVNTAGLIVSAAGMSNVNFMAGKLVFDQAANPNAAVVNQGSLTVKQAGLAALVAPQVANSGVITAKLGHVVLAGAKTATLDLYGDGMVSLDVNNAVTQAPAGPDGAPVAALVTNTGVIRADGGTVQLTAREADGLVQNLVQAGGRISANSVGSKTGMVELGGLGGSIVLSGVVTADGGAAGSTGGKVQVDASQGVTLAAGSRVKASGQAGGGTVAIGTTLARATGGPGTASALTAQTVSVEQGARINASATGNGDGGRVTVLSSLSTSMAGAIVAKGGPQGGNGGFIETSGAAFSLGASAIIDARALSATGQPGTWLLDPLALDVVNGATDTSVNQDAGPPFTVTPTGGGAQISNGTIDTQLNGGTNVVLTTEGTGTAGAGNITVDAGATITWTTAATLTMNSAGAISILAPVTSTAATLILTAGAGVSQDATNGAISVGDLALTAAGQVSLLAANKVTTLGALVSGSGNGLQFRDAATPLTVGANVGGSGINGITTHNGEIGLSTTTSGSVTVSAGIASSGGEIDIAAAPGAGVTNAAAINSGGGNVVILGNTMSLGGGTIHAGTTGTVVLGPSTTTDAIALGALSAAGVLGLSQASLSSVTAEMLQIGYRNEDATASLSHNINLATALTLSTSKIQALALVTGGAGGTVTQTAGATLTFTGGTLGVIAGGNVALPLANSVGTIAGLTDGGAGNFAYINGAALSVGALPAQQLGVAVSGTTGLASSAGFAVPVNTAGALAGVTVVGGATTGSIILETTGAGDLTLNQPVNANNGSTTLVASPGQVGLQAFGNITQASGGIITAAGLEALAGGSVTLEAAGNQIGNSAGAGTAGLLVGNAGTGSFALSAANALQIDSFAVTAGATALASTTGVTTTNNDIDLKSAGLTLDDPLAAGTGSVRLVESGTLLQLGAGPITASSLSVTDSGGSVALEAANGVATVAVNVTLAGGAFSFNDAMLLTVGSVAAASAASDPSSQFGAVTGATTANGDVNLLTAGLALNEAVAVGTGTVRLVEIGAVSQATAGAITAGSLSVTDTAGSVVLDAANAIGTVAANVTFAGGTLTLNDGTTALIDGSVGAAAAAEDPASIFQTVVTGVATSNADINLASGGLALNQALNAGTGTVRLVESGAVSQAVAGVITAASLSVTDTGGQVVLEAANAVGTAASNVTFAGGAFSFNDTLPVLTIDSVGGAPGPEDPGIIFAATVTGVTTANGDINLDAAGLTLNQALAAGTGTVRLVANGTITLAPAGTISAGSLSVTYGGGSFVLGSTNSVGTMAASLSSAGAGFTIDDGTTALTVGAVAAASAAEDPSALFGAVSGVTTKNGNIVLQGAGITVNQAVAAGTADVTLTSTGAISQGTSGAISGADLDGVTELDAGGSISLTGSGNAVGKVTLTSLNTAGTALSSGPVAFVDSVPLTIANLSVLKTGVATIGAVQLATTTASMKVETGAAVTGSSVEIGVGGANSVFTNDGAISATSAGTAPVGDVVILANAMALSGGTITAPDAVVLAPFTANVKITLGDTVAGTLSLQQVDLATITTAGVLQIGTPALTGDIGIAGTVGLATPAVPALALVTGGSVTEAAGGAVTFAGAGALAVVAGGPVSMQRNNTVSTLAGSTSTSTQGFAFTNANLALTVGEFPVPLVAVVPDVNNFPVASAGGTPNGLRTANGNITLATVTAGNLVLDAPVNAGSGTVTLNSVGTIDASLGAITAGVLKDTVATGGAATFTDAANAVGTLGPFAAGGEVSLTDAVTTLNVAGAVSGSAVTLRNSGGITFATGSTLSAGVGGTVELDASGGAIDASLGAITAGVLTDTVTTGGAATFTDAANSVGSLGPFRATGGIALDDTVVLTLGGAVTSTSGNVYLQTAAAGGIIFGAFGVNSVSGGTIGLQTDLLTNLGTPFATGTANAGATGTFELAPNTLDTPITLGAPSILSPGSLFGITAGTVRIGAVTLPSGGAPIVRAGPITIAGNFGASSTNLALDSRSGGIIETGTAILTAATLTGSAKGPVTLTNPNVITALGSFTTTGQFSLIDEVPTLTIAGAVSGSGVALSNIDGITFAAGSSVSAGTSGTVELDASGGAIDASLGAISAGVLTSTVTTDGAATFTDAANVVTMLGPFAAGGELSLTDAVPTLTVAGAVSGAGVTLRNTGGITFAAGSTLSAGMTGTVELDAANGPINAAQGAISAGLLTDTVTTGGAALFTNAGNVVTTLGPFAATGQVSLVDTAAILTVGGAVSGSGVTLNNPGGISFAAGSSLSAGTSGTVELDAASGNIAASLGAITAGVLTSTVFTEGAVAFTDAANAVTTLGPFAVNGSLSLTDGVPTLHLAGAVSGSQVTLRNSGGITFAAGSSLSAGNSGTVELDAAGGPIDAGLGSIRAFVLTDAVTTDGAATFTNAANFVFTLGPFAASGQLSLTDAVPTLSVVGAVSASGVTLNNPGGIAFGGLATLSAGAGGTVELDAAAGAIDASTAAITAGVLTDTVTTGGAATFTDASNAVGTLGPFAAGGSLSLTDTVPTLMISGAVSGSGVTLKNSGGISFAAGSSLSAGTSGTAELDASGGAIDAHLGAITAGVLTDAVTTDGAATFTDAANAVGTLGPFAATGQVSLTDTVATLDVAAGVSGSGVTLKNSGGITFAAGSTLSAGTNGTVELDASDGAIDAHLGAITAGVLTDTVATGGAAVFTDAANVVTTLGPFAATGQVTLIDTVPLLNVVGSVSGSGVTLNNPGGISFSAGSSLSAGVGGTVELDAAVGGIDAHLGAITAGVLTASVTTGGAATFTDAANAVGTLGPFAAGGELSLTDAVTTLNVAGAVSGSGVTLNNSGGITFGTGSTLSAGVAGTVELDAAGGAIDAAQGAITAGVLTDTVTTGGAAVFSNAANAVGTLGPFAAAGQVTLTDTVPTLTVAGAVLGSGVTLNNPGGIVLSAGSTVSAGAGGTVELDASGGAIDASLGAITAGVLTDTVATGGAAIFTDAANSVATLGPFAAGGELSLTDTVTTLDVGGAVSGAGVTLRNSGGIVFASGSSLSAGIGGTLELDASSGAIDAHQGAITAGVLTDTVTTGGAATFTDAANAVGALGPFAATGQVTLVDNVPTLAVEGAVSGSGVTLNNPGGITFTIGSTLSAGTSGTVELDASGGPINASFGAITAGLLTNTVATGGAATFTDAANAVTTLGPFAAGGELSLTDTVPTLNIAGAVSASGVTLINPGGITFLIHSTLSAGASGTVELDASAGSISALQGAITAGVLTDSVTTGGSATFTNAANAVGALGPFAAAGQVSLTDTAGTLVVSGAVSGSGVTLNNPGGIAFAAGSTLSAGTSGTVELDASAGAIDAHLGAITAGLLTDTVTTGGAATFTDAANAVGTLGPFAASGQLSLTDTVPTLQIAGAVSGSGVTLNNPGGIAFSAGSTLSAGVGGTVELDASGGAIDAHLGAITADMLTNSVTMNGSALFTDAANVVTTLGPFAVTGLLSLTDNVPTLNVAGAVSGSGVTLKNTGGISFAAGSTLSAGTSGTVELDAPGGPIDAAQGAITAAVLTDTVMTGGSALFTNAANAVTTLGPFAAAGEVSLTDTVPTLSVAGAVSGSGITLVNPGGIFLTAGSTLSAGTGGTVELDAAGGAIDASLGAITAGVLTGAVTTGGAATFTNAGNTVTTLGPFAAVGALSLTDNVATLNVGGAVSGSGVTLQNTGGITFAAGSTLSAGAGGTVELDASGGPIDASLGAITAGLLTDTVTTGGAALFTNAANVVTTLGPFAATGQLTLIDTVPTLNVAGAISGSGVTLNNPGGIIFAAGSTLSAGAGGTVELDASGGPIDASLGAITAGVLTDTVTTGGAATFSDAANVVGTLGPFAAGGELSLTDNVPTLTIAGAVSGGGVTLNTTGGITFAALSTLSAGPTGTLTVNAAGGPIDATLGAITAGVLTDSVTTGGAATFTDLTNAVTTLGPFASTGALSLTDDTALTLTGLLSATQIVVNTQANPLTMAAGTTLVTGGTAAPNQTTITAGQIPINPPLANGVGAYFTSGTFTQLGTANVTPIAGSANTILSLNAVQGTNITLAGLNGPTTWLILGLEAPGSKVTGAVTVRSLTVQLPVNSIPSDFSVTLHGTVGGVGGQEAAGQAGVVPTRGTTIQFNDCPIGTVGCVLLSGVPVPTGNPIQYLTLGILVAPNDEDNLLLPLVSDEDYLSCLLRKDCN